MNVVIVNPNLTFETNENDDHGGAHDESTDIIFTIINSSVSIILEGLNGVKRVA